MIAAIIAAAGKSSRMGPPKQLLPWQDSTVIESVVANLEDATVAPIVCVLGRERKQITAQLSATSAVVLENPDYKTTEMLRSFQLGLAYLLEKSDSSQISGTLLSLGDQPHIRPETIQRVTNQIKQTPNQIVIPSHNMRRGHPFYLPRTLWQAVLDLDENGTLRQLLKKYDELIAYVNCPTDEILRDIDTPEDYEAMRRRWDHSSPR